MPPNDEEQTQSEVGENKYILPKYSNIKMGDKVEVLDGEFKGQIKEVKGKGNLSHFETGEFTDGTTVFVENAKGEHVPVTHWKPIESKSETLKEQPKAETKTNLPD